MEFTSVLTKSNWTVGRRLISQLLRPFHFIIPSHGHEHDVFWISEIVIVLSVYLLFLIKDSLRRLIHCSFVTEVSTFMYSKVIRLPLFVLNSVVNNTTESVRMSTESSSLLADCKKLLPTMSETSHKGTSGRIGICGGSVEFTGAPYFSGISALRTGADLVYVFSASSAAPVIKTYSPELMVLPYLNVDDAVNLIFPWLKRLHALVIGPGLGRNETVFNNIHELLKLLTVTPADNGIFRPLIIDADGLHFLSHNVGVFKNYPGDVYLTPNCVEFNNLVHAVFGHNYQEPTESILSRLSSEIGKNVTIILKGNIDIISNRHKQLICSNKGSLRRCGGQGDVLSGIVATFAAWACIRKWQDAPVIHKEYSDSMLAAYSACYLTRECSRITYEMHSRSMLVTDMIKELPRVFSNYFG